MGTDRVLWIFYFLRPCFKWTLAILCAVSLSVGHAADVPDSNPELLSKVHSLANIHDWEGIKSALKSRHWNPDVDFDLITLLIVSHFETKRPFEITEYVPKVSEATRSFASAYMLLLSGDLSNARQVFESMIRREEVSIQAAGLLGMLEYATHVSDIQLLSKTLIIARKTAGTHGYSVRSRLIEYEAAYLYSSSRLKDLSSLLQKTTRGYGANRLDPVSFTYYKAFLHFVRNEFTKAYAALDQHCF